MKKYLVLGLVLVLCLSMMGCMADLPFGSSGKAEEDPASVPEQTQAAEPEQNQAVTEAPAETAAPASETPAATEAPAVQPTGELVTESVSREGKYTIEFDEGYSQENSYNYHVPALNADTAGAKAINGKIEERFGKLANGELESIENKIGSAVVEIGWQSEVWNGVLSLVVFDRYDWESTDYCVYYYDTQSGAELGADEMLGRLDLSERSYLSGCRRAIEEKYEENYGDLTEEQRIDYGYYVMENAIDDYITMDYLPFFVEESGRIGVAAPIPSLAGASYYISILYPSFERD